MTTSEERKYVILMETNDEEKESWYYFLKLNGNEENINHLNDQINDVEWYLMDGSSVFDLDTEHPVSEQTAKELIRVELNSHTYHRKFDGVLERIDFEFREKDSAETRICKVFDVLGYGQIEEYISDEEIDEEHKCDTDNESIDSKSSSASSSPEVKRRKGKLPSSLKVKPA